MRHWFLLFSLLTILLVGCGGDAPTPEAVTSPPDDPLQAVRDIAPEGSVVAEIMPGRTHDDSVRYEFDGLPPIGGTHSPRWQRCGIYERPVRPENAIHTMEHGGVWLAYQESLSSDDVSTLERAANSVSSVLMAPYPNLPTPVVVTAWGVQLEVDSADDPRIQAFIDAFARGPQNPEPQANCATGITTTDG